jgi:urease accessory protein UreH
MAMLSPGAATDEALAAIRAPFDGSDDCYGGASLLPNGAGVWVRLVARDGATLRGTMIAVWAAMRRSMTGVEPVARRK